MRQQKYRQVRRQILKRAKAQSPKWKSSRVFDSLHSLVNPVKHQGHFRHSTSKNSQSPFLCMSSQFPLPTSLVFVFASSENRLSRHWPFPPKITLSRTIRSLSLFPISIPSSRTRSQFYIVHNIVYVCTPEKCMCNCIIWNCWFGFFVAEMAARNLGGFLVLVLAVAICEAASVYQPITEAHRSAALELFKPVGGSFGRSALNPD